MEILSNIPHRTQKDYIEKELSDFETHNDLHEVFQNIIDTIQDKLVNAEDFSHETELAYQQLGEIKKLYELFEQQYIAQSFTRTGNSQIGYAFRNIITLILEDINLDGVSQVIKKMIDTELDRLDDTFYGDTFRDKVEASIDFKGWLLRETYRETQEMSIFLEAFTIEYINLLEKQSGKNIRSKETGNNLDLNQSDLDAVLVSTMLNIRDRNQDLFSIISNFRIGFTLSGFGEKEIYLNDVFSQKLGEDEEIPHIGDNLGVYKVKFLDKEKAEIINFYKRNKTILIQILGKDSYDSAIVSIQGNNTLYTMNYATRVYPYYVRGVLSGNLPNIINSFTHANVQKEAGYLLPLESENDLWSIDKALVAISNKENESLLYVTLETKNVIASIAKDFHDRSAEILGEGAYAKLTIMSLLRPVEYNNTIEGAMRNSAHTRGIGAEFRHRIFDIFGPKGNTTITDLTDISLVKDLQNILYGILLEHDKAKKIIFTHEGTYPHITVTAPREGINDWLEFEGLPESTKEIIIGLFQSHQIDIKDKNIETISKNMKDLLEFIFYIESHGGKNVENLLSSAKSPAQWLDGFKDGKPTMTTVQDEHGNSQSIRAFDRSDYRFSPFDTALRRNMRFYAEQSPEYNFETGDYYNYSKYTKIPTWIIDFYEGQPILSPLDLSKQQVINLLVIDLFMNEKYDMKTYIKKILLEGNKLEMIRLYASVHHTNAVNHKATRDTIIGAAYSFLGVPYETRVFVPLPKIRGEGGGRRYIIPSQE